MYKKVHQHLSIVRDAASLPIAMRELFENPNAASVWTRTAEWFDTGSRSNTSMVRPHR